MAAPGADSIVVDCSVVVKWELTAEPQAVEAMELLLDWQHKAVVVHAPGFLFLETSSALLRAQRQGSALGAAGRGPLLGGACATAPDRPRAGCQGAPERAWPPARSGPETALSK